MGAFHDGVTTVHLLLYDKCNEASNYRGMLLGHPWGTGATFDELYVARLKTDISQANIVLMLVRMYAVSLQVWNI